MLLRLGVSACLVGHEVRYDGQHKRSRYVLDVLGQAFDLHAVCPEQEAGFGVPREPMRLVEKAQGLRLMTTHTKRDVSDQLLAWIPQRLERIGQLDLSGFVLKNRSPSCGMARVKLHPEDKGRASHRGVGLFAHALMERFPWLPVEEEGRLNDNGLRENFVVRVFCHHRYAHVQGSGLRGKLVRFHSQHKLLLMAHSVVHMRKLGRLVAAAKDYRPKELRQRYGDLFFEAMRRQATRAKHSNVLQHISGYLRGTIDAFDGQELRAAIESYRLGQHPLLVPLTLLRHYIDKHNIAYVQDQHYLRPHPVELNLLNQA